MTMLGFGLALALEVVAPQPTCLVAAGLSAEIARLTDYTVTAQCPTVRRTHLSGQYAGQTQAAAYYPETGEIGLAPDIDLNTVIGRSYLLHEMVHAAQFAAGKDKAAPCHGRLEAEAYWVQAVYLRQHGEDAVANSVLLMASFLGACHGEGGARP